MRRWAAAASLWCLALIACASPATDAADVPASGASRDDGSDVGSIDAGDAIGDATRAGRVAVVFVTSRDAESLSPCRAGLLRALRASVADLPDHDVFVLHGGDATGPMAHRDPADDDERLRPATMLSQSALKPLVPERLRCDCSSGNGATPFAFMAWLASTDSSASEDDASSAAAEPLTADRKKKESYAFAWYVEEDVVFTGNWAEVFRLRLVSTPESRVREVEVFGELSGSSVRPTAGDDDRNAKRVGELSEPSDVSGAFSQSDAAAFATSPVDVVAHVERVTGRWKKRCRMPGDPLSPAQINGTGCVGHDGFVYSAWWPVIGLSASFARALTDSVADAHGANGHQEPLTMSFCRRMNHEHAKKRLKQNDDVRSIDATFGDAHSRRRSSDKRERSDSNAVRTVSSEKEKPPCAFRLAPSDALGEYQLGHWGRFVGRPKSHPTFTAPGLTYGHNLKLGRLYHPLKCEADAGIGALAAACAGAGARGGLGSAAPSPPAALDSAATPRRALAAEPGGGGGGGGGAKLSALSAALRETYFEKKPWALAFDDGGYGGRRAGERDGNGAEPYLYGAAVSASGERKKSRLEDDPGAYVAAKAAAKERNEAMTSRARAAARPYARPVRGPKKKTSDTGNTA